jgi:hypothetical protein
VGLAVLAAEFVRAVASKPSGASASEPEAGAVAGYETRVTPPPVVAPAPVAPPLPSSAARPAPVQPARVERSFPPSVPEIERGAAPRREPAAFELGAALLTRWFVSPASAFVGGAAELRAQDWLAHAGALAGMSRATALGSVDHAGAARGLIVTADEREVAGSSGLMLGVELGLRYELRSR